MSRPLKDLSSPIIGIEDKGGRENGLEEEDEDEDEEKAGEGGKERGEGRMLGSVC